MKKLSESDKDYKCDINANCFRNLSPAEIKLISGSKSRVLFNRGENLTKQGAFANYVLFVAEGLAKQSVEDSGSKRFNIRIFTPGEFVGLSSVFVKKPFSYSATAITDCLTYLIDNNTIEKLVKANNTFGYNIIQKYCEQNFFLFEIIKDINFRHTHGNLAGTILYINGFRDVNENIFNLLSRKDIAEFAGISTENTIKLLKSFEKEKLIELIDRNIIIRNEEKLREISLKG